MQNSLLKVLGVLAIIATLICFIFAALGMIGAVSVGNGCYMRYDPNGKGGTDSITSTTTLNANANYVTTSTMLPDGTTQLTPHPDHYGKWLNTQISVANGQEVTLQVNGQISLCIAYVPKNNVQFTESTRPGQSNLDDSGKMIPIPRVTDVNTPPVSLIMDAKNNEWRNITELYANDRVLVSVSPNYTTGATAAATDAFKSTTVTADCSQGQTTYNPICGRYSIYSGQYVNSCKSITWQGNYHHYCDRSFWKGCGLGCPCAFGAICCGEWICDQLVAWMNDTPRTMPEPYQDNGQFTFPYATNTGNLFIDYANIQCANNGNIPPSGQCPDSIDDRTIKDKDYIGGANCRGTGNGEICNSGSFQNDRKFWYTADGSGGNGPTGLIWQLSSTGAVSPTLPANPQFAQFVSNSDQPAEYGNQYKVIYNIPFNDNTASSYLQYRLWSPTSQDASKNTGGYVLNIKQTKCYRENGNSFSDGEFANRGQVQYIVVPASEDPNTSGQTYPPETVSVDSDGNAKFTANNIGYVWMRILNNQSNSQGKNDYADSEGNYKVQFTTSQQIGSFTLQVMNPLLLLFKSRVQGAAQFIFQNMVCYGGDTSSCINLFSYIKALLILYVMVYGGMFLLGFAKINQKELVTRMIKIIIVSGLMNGNTFEFFNNYLFNAITGFSDAIISNMSGYSLFTSTNTISNPFMFLDAVMSKILFSQTFVAQILALLSLGLSGVIYFIITFIAVVIVIITALRAVAVYIMAFMATCILIGVAPLFLSFLLFDFTRYLFDNWVKFTIRYMIEPVIMMAGIIVLTQLFTIYLDFVLGYSVCWKCALPIKIPFIGTILPIALLNVPIFCINWFAPWGMDYMSGMMGVNMQNIIALAIIAYGMYGYVEFSGLMTAKLTGAAGPTATEMGGKMASDAGQAALGQVGMDKKTRKDITNAAKGRLKQRNETLEKAEKGKKDTPKEEPEKKEAEPPKSDAPKSAPPKVPTPK